MRAFLRQNRFALLMVMLLGAFAMAPFADTFHHASSLYLLVTLAVMVGAVNAVSERSLGFWIKLAVALVVTGLLIGHAVCAMPTLYLVGQTFSVLFYLLVSASILRHVLLAERTEANTVFAAISVYLMMATIWAMLYALLEILSPRSFLVNGQPVTPSPVGGAALAQVEWLYFSIVTLTTLGYGDVLPQTGPARMLAGLEALIGQMYVAVLIAWLVGRYLSQGAAPAVARGDGNATNQKDRKGNQS
jgi:hypothetical protein